MNPSGPPSGLVPGEVTPRIADLLHLGAVHRRRMHEGRSSEVDRLALAHQLRHVQQLWPPNSPQRSLLQTSLQTIILWFEGYMQGGTHAEDLDAILQGAFATPPAPSSTELTYLGGWVREVNAADGYIVVRIAEQDITMSIENVTQHLVWWLLAEDVTFQVGLLPDQATAVQQGEQVQPDCWLHLIYDDEQLLDDDAFLAEVTAY